LAQQYLFEVSPESLSSGISLKNSLQDLTRSVYQQIQCQGFSLY